MAHCEEGSNIMSYILYTTGQNERWDTIAYKFGSTYNILPIIEANPHVKVSPVLPEGITLKIPVPEMKANNDKTRLPVWKQ